MASLRPTSSACPGLVLAIVALAGCGESPRRVTVQEPPGLTPRDCTRVIPDDALAAFGWDSVAPATVEIGRCQRLAGGAGNVTVGTRAVPAPSEERPQAVRRAFDERCAARPDIERVDWLDIPGPACARLLPNEHRGLAELFLLTSDGELVQIRVAVLEPIGEKSLRSGLNGLARAVESEL